MTSSSGTQWSVSPFFGFDIWFFSVLETYWLFKWNCYANNAENWMCNALAMTTSSNLCTLAPQTSRLNHNTTKFNFKHVFKNYLFHNCTSSSASIYFANVSLTTSIIIRLSSSEEDWICKLWKVFIYLVCEKTNKRKINHSTLSIIDQLNNFSVLFHL